tara:strand:+ start:499 stop:840 length:342 start_codon:yes stop_codon:yes gene_type:complete
MKRTENWWTPVEECGIRTLGLNRWQNRNEIISKIILFVRIVTDGIFKFFGNRGEKVLKSDKALRMGEFWAILERLGCYKRSEKSGLDDGWVKRQVAGWSRRPQTTVKHDERSE